MDDPDLVAAFQAGDEAAFTELVERHRRQVYRVARGILRSHEEADEAAQEAFVKAWQALPGFRNESSFRTWMVRIAMNAAFDLRSREAVRRRVRDEAALEPAAARPPSGPRTIDALIQEEDQARVRQAVGRLPERQRVTLTLKVQEGLKYTEIAEVLGCPVGTAKANFHHAVQSLKRLLGKGGRAPERGPRSGMDQAGLAGDDHDT